MTEFDPTQTLESNVVNALADISAEAKDMMEQVCIAASALADTDGADVTFEEGESAWDHFSGLDGEDGMSDSDKLAANQAGYIVGEGTCGALNAADGLAVQQFFNDANTTKASVVATAGTLSGKIKNTVARKMDT